MSAPLLPYFEMMRLDPGPRLIVLYRMSRRYFDALELACWRGHYLFRNPPGTPEQKPSVWGVPIEIDDTQEADFIGFDQRGRIVREEFPTDTEASE